MKSLKSRFLALAAVVTLVCAGTASAQIINYTKTGTGVAGIIIPVFNVVDSLIYDGEIVIVDTSATTGVKRIGVKRYTGLAVDRNRVIGPAVGNIKKSSQGGSGQVLIYGYHPGVHGVKALAAGNVVRPGAINGSVATGQDSASMAVGRVLRGVAGATNKDNARYGIFWWGGSRVIVTL